jgi:hypothetical protein
MLYWWADLDLRLFLATRLETILGGMLGAERCPSG